jgi:hypothetical protein
MTRLELLTILVGKARANGFEFRRWYMSRLGLPWISSEAALTLLDTQRRYYALLFSHEFAENFWKAGSDITFKVPAQTFMRVMSDGSTRAVSRKSFVRRTARRDVWRYHLGEMASADEPLRYIRKYLQVEDELDESGDETPQYPTAPILAATTKPISKSPLVKRAGRPLSEGQPEFLKRPYRP